MNRTPVASRLAVVALILSAVSPGVAHASALDAPVVTSGELVERPKEYDGTTITFTGEAIGEDMGRGAMTWIHLNDDAYMERNVEEGAKLGGYNSGHAVWVDAQEASRIAYFGDYSHEGDIVRVIGTFNAACLEHGGDMDIHAESLVVVRDGHPVDDPVRPSKIWWALALSAAAAGLFMADRRFPH